MKNLYLYVPGLNADVAVIAVSGILKSKPFPSQDSPKGSAQVPTDTKLKNACTVSYDTAGSINKLDSKTDL